MTVEHQTKRIAGYDVEFTYDSDSRNWGFKVPELHIVGGDETRSDAERMAREAISFTLEDDNAGGGGRGWWLVVGGLLIGSVLLAKKALGGVRAPIH